jgi:hypothetical protein
MDRRLSLGCAELFSVEGWYDGVQVKRWQTIKTIVVSNEQAVTCSSAGAYLRNTSAIDCNVAFKE